MSSRGETDREIAFAEGAPDVAGLGGGGLDETLVHRAGEGFVEAEGFLGGDGTLPEVAAKAADEADDRRGGRRRRSNRGG